MKYKITEVFIEVNGKKLFQIECVKGFKHADKGDKGGYIEKEENLSQHGNSWVFSNARVSGDAWVYGNALVYGDARVYGNALVYGDAWVSGNALVYGNARVSDNARCKSLPPATRDLIIK